MVYPQGSGFVSSWNVFTWWVFSLYDDVAFTSAMIADIDTNADYNIDLDRVYATGFSNGGYMSYRLACDFIR